jgi:hypothetical protein
MAKMKFKRDEFDPKALDAPYDPGERRQNYLGEVPKTGTPLNMRVTKAWMTLSKDGSQQTKLLLIAEQNDGKYEEFNGLPVWEPLTWSKPSARRYMAFLTNFDLTTHDVFNSMDVEVEDDNVGTPINSIADWEVGSDDALCRIIIRRDRNLDGELVAKVDWDGWLPFEEPEETDEEPEERPARRPARAKSAAASRRRAEPEPEPEPEDEDDDEYDDDAEDEYEDEDEPETEPEPPVRRRRGTTTTRPAARTNSRAPARETTRGRVRDNKAAAGRAADRDRRGYGSNEELPF